MKGDVCQSDQRMKGDVCLSDHKMKDDACLSDHKMKGDVCLSDHKMKGDVCLSDHKMKVVAVLLLLVAVTAALPAKRQIDLGECTTFELLLTFFLFLQ